MARSQDQALQMSCESCFPILGNARACEAILALEKLRCRSPSGCDRSTAPDSSDGESARSGAAQRLQISPNNGCFWVTIVA
jgi:hypothetical protein